MSATTRWARAAVLAAVVLGFGSVAHVTADGHLPGLPGMSAVGLLCLVACFLLLARPASALRIVALTVAGQASVHVLLTMVAGHGPAAAPRPTARLSVVPSVPEGRRTGSLQDFYASALPAPSGHGGTDPIGHLLADFTAANAPMMTAHLAAAVVVGLWLALGERALWTLVALAAGALTGRLALLVAGVVVPRVRSGLAAPARTVPLPTPLRVARPVVRRGPPALLAA